MKRLLLRLWCRVVGHVPVYSYRAFSAVCDRCGAKVGPNPYRGKLP